MRFRRWVTAVCLLTLSISCTRSREVTLPITFDEAALTAVDEAIIAGEYGEINSWLMWTNDELVWEGYYRGAAADDLHPVYSVTKSVTSAAVGIALDEGAIAGVDTAVLDFFPDYTPTGSLNPRKKAMTLEDLLTMRAGFAWDEFSTIYGNDSNDATQLSRSPAWMTYMLDRNMAEMPGDVFVYNSGVTMLLSGILQQSTGLRTDNYVALRLFAPLGIDEWRWDSTPDGYANTGWGLWLSPRDMLTFGQLFLQNGRWQDQQLIPENWIHQSTQPLVDTQTGFHYGYQWWRFSDDHTAVANLTVNDLYFAWGFGGQFIFVIPHLDLVIVATAENFENSEQFFAALGPIFAAIE
ncbi:MAG: serine hydrolase [Anaerolineaceae bacterium]|nr:serine hydrolase [Anaerolineaceae bacterium]